MPKKKIPKSKVPEGYRLPHGYVLVKKKRATKKTPTKKRNVNVPQPK